MIAAVLALAAVASQCLLTVVQANPIVSDEAIREQLKAACKGEHVDISLEKLNALAADINGATGIDCPEHMKSGIIDMNHLIENGREDVCSKANLDRIEEFRVKHLVGAHDLPRSLEAFVLSYIMRTSQACKTAMVQFLTSEVNELITDEDYEKLAEWTGKGGELDQLLNAVDEGTKVILPSDLAASVEDSGIGILLEVGTELHDDIRHIKRVCKKRFQPIYGPIILPIRKLSAVGFDYSDVAIREELSINDEQRENLDRFNRIVFLCETMGGIRGGTQESGDDSDGDGDGDSDGEDDDGEDGLEQIDYKPEHTISIGDFEPLPAEQIELLSEGLKRHMTETSVIRRAIFDKLIDIITETLPPEMAKSVKEALNCLAKINEKGIQHHNDDDISDETGVEIAGESAGEQGLCRDPASIGAAASTVFIGVSLSFVTTLIVEDGE